MGHIFFHIHSLFGRYMILQNIIAILWHPAKALEIRRSLQIDKLSLNLLLHKIRYLIIFVNYVYVKKQLYDVSQNDFDRKRTKISLNYSKNFFFYWLICPFFPEVTIIWVIIIHLCVEPDKYSYCHFCEIYIYTYMTVGSFEWNEIRAGGKLHFILEKRI